MVAGKNSETVQQTSTLAADAAGILERDYGIDAGEVLSMNVDTVETSGLDAQSPDFAAAVNDSANWQHYAQKTYSAAFADSDGYLLSRVNPAVSSGSQGYYQDVVELPRDNADGTSGATEEPLYLAKIVRDSSGFFSSYNVKTSIPIGTTTAELLDPKGKYALTGAVYSYVTGGSRAGVRTDYDGWYGTGFFNKNEYDADNINAKFHLVQGGNLNEGFAFLINYDDVTYDTVAGESVPRINGFLMSYTCHNNKAKRVLWRVDNFKLDKAFTNLLIGCAPGYDYATNGADIWHKGVQKSSNTGVFAGGTSTVTCLAEWDDDAKNIDYEVEYRDNKIQIYRTDWGNDIDGSHPSITGTPGGTNVSNANGVTFTNKRDTRELVCNIGQSYNEATGTTSYLDASSGATIASVKGKPYTKGTYGFWGQNCEQGNQALVTGLNVGITKTKSFGDIVYEPSWTDGALHMLINIDSKADRTMLGSDGGTEMLCS